MSYAKAAVKPPQSTTPMTGETYFDAIKNPSRGGTDPDMPGDAQVEGKPKRRLSKKESRHVTIEDDARENEELLQKQARINQQARERDEELRRKTGEEVIYGQNDVSAKERKAQEKTHKEERKKQEKHEREERLKNEKHEKEEREKQEKHDREVQEKHEKEERRKHEMHEREERLKNEKHEREERARREKIEKAVRVIQEKAEKEEQKHREEEEKRAREEEKKRHEREAKHAHKEREHHEKKEKQEHSLKKESEQREQAEKEKAEKIANGVRTPTKTGEEVHSEADSSERSETDHDEKSPLISALPQWVVPSPHPVRPNLSSVRWAPLRGIPLHRRLETTAVLWHACSAGILLSLFWFILAIPLTWPLLVPYLLYVLFSSTHVNGSVPYKTRSDFFRRLPLWRFYINYFPIQLHRTAELPTDQNYIFAYHPHGIISHGAFGTFAVENGFAELFPGITNTLLTLDTNFRVPFYREYLLALGLASVSRRSCEALLRGDGEPSRHARQLLKPSTWLLPPARDQRKNVGAGRAITIVIGGARESLEALPGRMRLVVKRRRGFLKIAIKTGAAVVPVLGFGENSLYDQVIPAERSWVHGFQLAVKRYLGFTLPLFHARGVFNYDVGLMPYRRPVNVVIGRPVFPKEQMDDPRDPDVDELQQRYCDELIRLWEAHKDTFALDRIPGEEGEMVFIE